MMERTTSLDAAHLKYAMRCVFRWLMYKKSKNGFILWNCDVYASSEHAENIEKDHFTLKIFKPHQAHCILRWKLPLVGYYSNNTIEI